MGGTDVTMVIAYREGGQRERLRIPEKGTPGIRVGYLRTWVG